MYDSTILHLYSVLYVYHPQLSLLPSSFSPFTLFQFPLPPFPSGDHHTVVLSLRSFFFLRFYLQKKKRFYLLLFGERGREGERKGERHQGVAASHMPPTRDLAHDPGMCPDWESNQRPFGLQAGTQSTEPHQPGRVYIFFT